MGGQLPQTRGTSGTSEARPDALWHKNVGARSSWASFRGTWLRGHRGARAGSRTLNLGIRRLEQAVSKRLREDHGGSIELEFMTQPSQGVSGSLPVKVSNEV